jgi:hypothetical protein
MLLPVMVASAGNVRMPRRVLGYLRPASAVRKENRGTTRGDSRAIAAGVGINVARRESGRCAVVSLVPADVAIRGRASPG